MLSVGSQMSASKSSANAHDTLAYRLSAVLTKLNQGEVLNPQDLAEEFGVNLRTIQRDLNVRFAGLPLIKVNGRYKMNEAHLGRLTIKDIEQFASFTGTRGLFPDMNTRFLKEIITSNAHDAWQVNGHHYEDLHAKRDIFASLEQAIIGRRTVQFRYSKADGDVRLRSAVEPYKLINQKGIWYLAAWEIERLKAFAISRISALTIDNTQFIPKEHVAKELAETDGIWLGLLQQRVLIRVGHRAASFFRRRQLVPKQVIESELSNGDILVSSVIAHPDEIMPIVRYWIPHARIVEPPEWQRTLEIGLRDYVDGGGEQAGVLTNPGPP